MNARYIDRRTIMTPQENLQREFQVAIAHHQAGRLAEAEASYRNILARVPNHPDALHLLGVLAGQAGRPDIGIELIRHAISINPKTADYHCNLAEIYRRVGKFSDAVVCARQAIELRPNYVMAWSNLGIALRDSGKPAEAVEALRRAIELGGSFAELYGNLGNALRDLGQLEAAIAAYEQAIRLNPGYVSGHNNLAVTLSDKKMYDQAIAAVRRAMEIAPNNPDVHYNLGGILMDIHQFERAREAFLEAIRLKPNFAMAHNNLGTSWMMQRHPAKALPEFEKAVQLDPGLSLARFNRGIVHLTLGDFARGWPDYECRAAVKPQFIFMRQGSTRPRWDGKPLDGRTIFVHAEQGFGDTIQFVRFVPMLERLGGNVILGVQPHVERLIRQIPGVDRIVCSIDPELKYDVHCPLLSLPMMLGIEIQALPGKMPYLQAEPQWIGRWQSRLGEYSGKKVGLAWAGSTIHEYDSIRTIRLEEFAPLAQCAGVHFFSLQKWQTPSDPPPEKLRLIDWMNEVEDFADTAGLIANLDLVITVDSAVAHLAAAMGKPVWILVPSSPDWRWMVEREDSPWYPSARLFRQEEPDDWRGVLESVASELGRSCPA